MKLKDEDVLEILNEIASVMTILNKQLELLKAQVQFIWEDLANKEFPDPHKTRLHVKDT